ncbi:MAG: outer membrane beta-barrel family protein, partial [Prevotella sp.]|nr:outer membrane beta-barrel family protein [Prevotella sp.]
DPAEDAYSALDTTNSRSSDTRAVTHNIRANFNSNKTNYAYNVGISISPLRNSSKSFVENYYGPGVDSVGNTISQNAVNYAPFADFTYRFTGNRMLRQNLRFRYNGQVRQPTVSQLDPYVNTNNPSNIRSGNPNLLPTFNNTLSLTFNRNNRASQHNLTATLSYTFVKNQIINYTSRDEVTDIKYTMPINENGAWNTSGRLTMNIPLDSKKRFRFSPSTNIGYDNNILYSKASADESSKRYVSNTLNLRQNITVSYSNNWYYGQLRGNINYSHTRYSLEGLEGKESCNYSATYNTQLTLPWSLSISSDITYTGNSGLSAGYNKNEVMWNAEVSKQFLRQNRGSLRFQITDILHQRLNIRRSVGGDYVQDSEFTALPSYFIISFAYRFNQVGGRGNRGRNRMSMDGEMENGGGFERGAQEGGFGRRGGGRDQNF